MRLHKKFLVVAMVALCGVLAVGQAGGMNQVLQCVFALWLYQMICCPAEVVGLYSEDAFDLPIICFLPTETGPDGAIAATYYYMQCDVTDLPIGHAWKLLVGGNTIEFQTDDLESLGTGVVTLEQETNDGLQSIRDYDGAPITLFWDDCDGLPLLGADVIFGGGDFPAAIEDCSDLDSALLGTDDNNDGIPFDQYGAEAEIDFPSAPSVVEIVELNDFEPIPGYIYELWLAVGSGYESLGRFQVDGAGNIIGSRFFDRGSSISSLSPELLITLEPQGETVGNGLNDPYLPILVLTELT